MSTSLEFAKRSLYCGEVRSSNKGEELILKGWVHRRRDHGRLMFIDLRDRDGLVQIRINPDSLENDRKIGVDVNLIWTDEVPALLEKLKAITSETFELTALVQGDINIWPDEREPKAGITEFRTRFLAKDNKLAVDNSMAEAFIADLKSAGFDLGEWYFVSQTHLIRDEFVIAVRGEVELRPDGSANLNLPTGETEIASKEIKILNTCETLPFRINDESTKTNEELRLRHRYLDLRRPDLQKHFFLRHKLYKATRDYLSDNGFIEVETPILGKPTPEGARDFLVPSRLHAGKNYALPQSPQLFKQILMVSGFDRYFQIARCFRDEDLRANRQPEFTQVDIEMSFITEDDIMGAMEGLVAAMWKSTLDIDIATPFRRMPYPESMNRFGSDKPDLRFDMELTNLSDTIKGRTEFGIFSTILDGGGSVIGVVHEGGAEKYSNTALKPNGDFQKQASRETGCRGAAWFRMNAEGVMESSIAKFFADDVLKEIAEKTSMKPGDMLFLLADKKLEKAQDMAGRLRLMIARDNGMIDKSKFAFCWIVDFPLFYHDEESNRWDPAHHPFTAPHPDDIDKLETDPGNVRSLAYDLALNGDECGGGSIRIHNCDVQKRIFKAIGISDEEAKEKFGFLLDALQFGAPPHGGIAFGLDRCLMSILGTESIREVIAFPKTQQGTCLMSDAPGEVPAEQYKDLHIKSVAKKDSPKEGK
jgi:aspartyl-tRNA synthetase